MQPGISQQPDEASTVLNSSGRCDRNSERTGDCKSHGRRTQRRSQKVRGHASQLNGTESVCQIRNCPVGAFPK